MKNAVVDRREDELPSVLSTAKTLNSFGPLLNALGGTGETNTQSPPSWKDTVVDTMRSLTTTANLTGWAPVVSTTPPT